MADRHPRNLLLTVILALAAAVPLGAQGGTEPFLVGGAFGYGGGLQIGAIPVYAGSDECGTFRSGDLYGPIIGLNVTLPDLLGNDFGSSIALWWRRTHGRMFANPIDGQKVIDPGSLEFVTLDRAYVLQTRRDAVVLDMMSTWSPGATWIFSAGVSVALPMNLVSTQIDTVKGPGSIAFNDGTRSHIMIGGAVLSSPLLLFGPVATAGVQLPIGGGFMLHPALALHLDATSSVVDFPLRDIRVDATVALLYNLTLPPTPLPPPPPPVRPSLRASITIEGVDTLGNPVNRAEVTVGEMLRRRYMPLLPALFCRAGDVGIEQRYLSDTEGAIDNLPTGADAVELHRYTAAIIGDRMRREPTATLRLYGGASSDEAQNLAARRAVHLRQHLAERWRISPSRIILGKGAGPMKRSGETTEDGRIENRRVTMVSNNPRIIAPIVIEERSLEFNPPSIVMRPKIDAEAGVRNWRLLLRQGERVLATYSSDDSSGSSEMSWRIQSVTEDTVLLPIKAELIVVDSVGQQTSAFSELPVVVRRRRSIIDRRGEEQGGRSVYTMVAFDYDEATPGREDLELLHDIASRLTDGSRVTVTGFTDRIGQEQYNARLSERRARQVATILQEMVAQRGGENVEIRSEGTEQRRFTNDLPEGRIFSRGVQVDVAWR